jgi:hypothetical protein
MNWHDAYTNYSDFISQGRNSLIANTPVEDLKLYCMHNNNTLTSSEFQDYFESLSFPAQMHWNQIWIDGYSSSVGDWEAQMMKRPPIAPDSSEAKHLIQLLNRVIDTEQSLD